MLCHALESYTAVPFHERGGSNGAPSQPKFRPAYQGCSPVSDIWSGYALQVCSKYLPRAVRDPTDKEAREQMALAAMAAGVGFGTSPPLPSALVMAVQGVRGFICVTGCRTPSPRVCLNTDPRAGTGPSRSRPSSPMVSPWSCPRPPSSPGPASPTPLDTNAPPRCCSPSYKNSLPIPTPVSYCDRILRNGKQKTLVW